MADALCEQTKSPAVMLVFMVSVFAIISVQFTPSLDTYALNLLPTLVNFIQTLGNVNVPPPMEPLKLYWTLMPPPGATAIKMYGSPAVVDCLKIIPAFALELVFVCEETRAMRVPFPSPVTGW